MRIASYYARPAGYSTGGVNRSRQEWMSAFAGAGNVVSVINAEKGYKKRLVCDESISFLELPHIGRARATMIPVGFRRQARSFDLMYLHEGWTASNIIAAISLKFAGVPYVIMPHGVYESSIVKTLKRAPGRRRGERWLLENALAVHVFFDSEVAHVQQIAPKSQFIVAPTSISPSKEVWVGGGEYLAWAGRFDIWHKGIDLLLQAMKLIPESHRPNIRMIGPDHNGDKQRVVAEVKSLNLSAWVSVEHELEGDALNMFMARSKGFVHVPRWECLGRTIVDALMAGSPLLVSDQAHIAEPIRLAGAGLVCEESPEAIAHGLERLWAGDGLQYSEIGKSWARQYFSKSLSTAKWEEQLEALRAGPAGA